MKNVLLSPRITLKTPVLFSSTSLLVTDGHSIIVIDVTRKGSD